MGAFNKDTRCCLSRCKRKLYILQASFQKSLKMKNVRLTYFNGRGRAEVARLILSIAGEEFEDDRVEFSDWETLKPHQRFGQLPRIEIDGETLYQSIAINRFLARKYGLAGRNAMEEANVDMIVDCINDAFQGKFVMALQEGFVRKDEVRQKMLIDELISTELPCFLGLIQQVLKDNGGKYLVGSELTWADLMLVDFLDTIVTGHALMPAYKNPSALENYKSLSDYKNQIESLPKIRAYLQKRPNTGF